jgi:hypothetical protein
LRGGGSREATSADTRYCRRKSFRNEIFQANYPFVLSVTERKNRGCQLKRMLNPETLLSIMLQVSYCRDMLLAGRARYAARITSPAGQLSEKIGQIQLQHYGQDCCTKKS